MRKLSLLALLVSAFTAQADLLTALQAHEKKDFVKASAEFTHLLPLGNELAAFNLGAMAYNGEGQAVDNVKALAYFEFAAARDHADSKALVEKLKSSLSADEQQKAGALLAQLQQQVKVDRNQPTVKTAGDKREPIKRIEPKFPESAARDGVFGSVMMRILVNEQGDVEAVDVINAFPKGVFEKSALRAAKGWKYSQGQGKFIGRVKINYAVGQVDAKRVQHVFDQSHLWQFSAMGSPAHQNALATVLDLARSQSAYTQYIDKSLPAVLGPVTPQLVAEQKPLSATVTLPAELSEDPFVTLDAQGKVTAVNTANNLDAKREATLAAQLVGHQLTTDKIDAGFYRLAAHSPKPRLYPAQRIAQTYDDYYWLEQAARGGNVEAQRAMASLRPDWEMYMLEQQDPVVQSWAGTRLIIDGNKAAGEKLLNAAIAKGHAAAKELKAAL